jgi:hypothetical protein
MLVSSCRGARKRVPYKVGEISSCRGAGRRVPYKVGEVSRRCRKAGKTGGKEKGRQGTELDG